MHLRIRETGDPSSVELEFDDGDGNSDSAGLRARVKIDGDRPLADCLFPQDGPGHAIRERLEGVDRDALGVEILGNDARFHAQAWERVVFPGDAAPLAARCAGFHRSDARSDAQAADDPAAAGARLDLLCLIGSAGTPSAAVLPMLARLAESTPPLRIALQVDPDVSTLAEALAATPSTMAVHIDALARIDDHADGRGGDRGIALRFDASAAPLPLERLLARCAAADVRLVTLALAWDADIADAALAEAELAVGIAALRQRFPTLCLVLRMGRVGAWQRAMDAAALYRVLAAGVGIDHAVAALRKDGATEESGSRSPPLVQYGSGGGAMVSTPEQDDLDRMMRQPHAQLRARMHDFRAAMLPPDCMQSASGSFLLAFRDAGAGRTSVLTGEAGCGKTHLAHQLAYAHCLQRDEALAFYFDFDDAHYTVSDMCRMIAPALRLDAADPARVEAALGAQDYLFVLDAFPDVAASPPEASAAWADTVDFLRRLSERHRIVFVGNSPWPTVRIALPPPTVQELRLIAHQQIEQLRKAEKPTFVEIDAIVQASQANPWLLKQAIARLLTHSASTVAGELAGLDHGDGANLKRAYYDHQFAGLPRSWQRLLVAMLAFPAFFFELLGVAPGRNDDGQAITSSAALLQALGQPAGSLSQATTALESAGFLQRTGLGRLLSVSARRYLTAHQASEDAALNVALCRVLCDALCRIAPQLQQTSHQMLGYHVVANRRLWARALEVLWGARAYGEFFAAREQLQRLLAVYRLQSDMDEWSHDLARRSGALVDGRGADDEGFLAWLSLARASLASKERADAAEIVAAAATIETHLFGLDASELEVSGPEASEQDKAGMQAMFGLMVNFLEGFHLARAQWEACHRVSAHALEIAERIRLPNRTMRSLKSMAKCAAMLGRPDESLALEERLLHMTYAADLDIPPRTQLMLGMECVDARIARGATEQAEALLETLRARHDAPPLAPLFDRYAADLLFAQDRHAAALERYAGILRDHGAPGLGVAGAAHIEARIEALRSELDAPTFERLSASPGTDAAPPTLH